MSSNPMNQSPKDQFLHWRQEMEKKQEEQVRQMKELQCHVERLQHENDQLRAQIEKSHDLGKDVRDSGRTLHPIPHNRGKEPIIPDDVDTPADNELFSSSSPSLSLSHAKNVRESTKARSHKRSSHHPAFNDVVSDTFRRARREVDMWQNEPDQALGNALVLLASTMQPLLVACTMPPIFPTSMMPPLPLVHHAFGTRQTFYMPPTSLIQGPDDMLYLSLRQHILYYEPPRGFVIPAFAMFDGYSDPYDHMLHYNKAMILNAENDQLLCKVFSASLRGPALAWFHKIPRNSINSFNELWAAFIL